MRWMLFCFSVFVSLFFLVRMDIEMEMGRFLSLLLWYVVFVKHNQNLS